MRTSRITPRDRTLSSKALRRSLLARDARLGPERKTYSAPNETPDLKVTDTHPVICQLRQGAFTEDRHPLTHRLFEVQLGPEGMVPPGPALDLGTSRRGDRI